MCGHYLLSVGVGVDRVVVVRLVRLRLRHAVVAPAPHLAARQPLVRPKLRRLPDGVTEQN